MDQSRIDEIYSEARKRRGELVEFCRTLVEIETPSDHPDRFDTAFEILRQALEEVGIGVWRHHGTDTAGHLYARPKTRVRHEPRQLILGHVDTVWDPSTIDERPFEVQDDERMTGPGVFDMKAGLAQLIVALRITKDLDISLPLTPLILINSDEEIGSPESTRYIRCLARLVDRCFVLEPAMAPDGEIKTARKGVGHFTVTISGRASHAGISPKEGSSAILELSHVIQSLNELNNHSAGISVNVGVIEGGTRSNVVASESVAEVDVRVKNNAQANAIERQIRNLEPSVDGVTLSVEGGFRRPPMEFDESNKQLWHQIRDQAERLGIELEHTRTGGASDGNTASQHTATIDGLGPVGDGAHESYEYVDIDGLVDRTALLVVLLVRDEGA